MKNRRFLLKLFIFCVLPLPFIYSLSHVVDKGLHKSKQIPFKEWNTLFNGAANTNLLIIGSSRAGHFVTEIIDMKLQLKSYNFGTDGYAFDMQHCGFECYLKYNKKPKYILQSLDFFTLEGPLDLYNSNQFLPYLNETIIQKTCSKYKGAFPLYYYYFPLIKYRNEPALIVEGIRLYQKSPPLQQDSISGYQVQDKPWDNAFDRWKKRKPKGYYQPVSSKTCLLFESYLSFCKKNNIQIVLVYSPEYKPAQDLMCNRSDIAALYKSYSKKYKVPFLDYGNDSICDNKSFFVNGTHLNKKGAALFTAQLVKDLKKIMF